MYDEDRLLMTHLKDSLPYAVVQRLRMLECLLARYGAVNRSVIVDYFGLSVPQASADFSLYKRLAPDNMEYDLSAKAYMRCDGFKRLWP